MTSGGMSPVPFESTVTSVPDIAGASPLVTVTTSPCGPRSTASGAISPTVSDPVVASALEKELDVGRAPCGAGTINAESAVALPERAAGALSWSSSERGERHNSGQTTRRERRGDEATPMRVLARGGVIGVQQLLEMLYHLVAMA